MPGWNRSTSLPNVSMLQLQTVGRKCTTESSSSSRRSYSRVYIGITRSSPASVVSVSWPVAPSSVSGRGAGLRGAVSSH